MPIVNGVVTAGPRLSADAAVAVGASSTVLSYLCGNVHGKILIWNKFKPIGNVPFPFVRTAGDNSDASLIIVETALGTRYWQGMDGNCGFSYPLLQQIDQITSYSNGSLNGWQYNPPTGGEKSPYRLGDFIGYCITVAERSGIGSVALTGSSFNVGDTGVALTFGARPTSATALGYADFIQLRRCYFGALIRKQGATSGGWKVIATEPILNASNQITTNGGVIQLSGKNSRPVEDTLIGGGTGKTPGLQEGTWICYPFLYKDGVYIPIPYANSSASGGLIVTVQAEKTMTIIAYLSNVQSNGKATLNVKLSNIPDGNSGRQYSISVAGMVSEGSGRPSQGTMEEGFWSFSGTISGTSVIASQSITIPSVHLENGQMYLKAVGNVVGTTYKAAECTSWEEFNF